MRRKKTARTRRDVMMAMLNEWGNWYATQAHDAKALGSALGRKGGSGGARISGSRIPADLCHCATVNKIDRLIADMHAHYRSGERWRRLLRERFIDHKVHRDSDADACDRAITVLIELQGWQRARVEHRSL